MKTKKSALKWLPLAAAACVCCALTLPAQTPPTITTQPLSQTNPVGTNITFTVAVSGTGPFTYQWEFDGANLPTNIITTVAGNGGYGYSGDGGSATNAEFAGDTASPLTPQATCILPTTTTTESARWIPTTSLPRWRVEVLAATGSQPPTPH
jgi:hypothetical protein